MKIDVPILMFSVMDDELYETAALDAGADQFVLKTISIPLLLSKLEANLRRYERETGTTLLRSRWLGIGNLKLDRENRVLTSGDKKIELTVRETRVLEVFTEPGASPLRSGAS